MYNTVQRRARPREQPPPPERRPTWMSESVASDSARGGSGK